MSEEIANYKKTNPLRNSISLNDIFNMLVTDSNGSIKDTTVEKWKQDGSETTRWERKQK